MRATTEIATAANRDMAFSPRFSPMEVSSKKIIAELGLRPEFGVIKNLPEIERSVHAGPAVLTQPFDLVLHL